MHSFHDSSVGKESVCNAGDPSSIPGSRRSTGEGISYPLQYSRASLVAQLVKNPPAMREIWIQSLGWEDSPGEGKGYPLQYSGLENSKNYTVHGICQARILKWVAFPFSRGSSQTRDQTKLSHNNAGGFFTS